MAFDYDDETEDDGDDDYDRDKMTVMLVVVMMILMMIQLTLNHPNLWVLLYRVLSFCDSLPLSNIFDLPCHHNNISVHHSDSPSGSKNGNNVVERRSCCE